MKASEVIRTIVFESTETDVNKLFVTIGRRSGMYVPVELIQEYIDERPEVNEYPKPWYKDELHVNDANGEPVVFATKYGMDRVLDRIISCVNSLEGIEDPKVFIDAAKELMSSSGSLMAQYSTLFSYMEQLLILIEHGEVRPNGFNQTINTSLIDEIRAVMR